MTREEKCELAIQMGFKYDFETGIIYRFDKILYNNRRSDYVRMNFAFKNEKIKLLGHHFAWYCVYGNCDTEQIDHINRIKYDNRICNLRNVNQNQNMWNKKNTKGYSWNKNANKWQAQIQVNGKLIYLGIHTREQEAKQAYLNAKEKYHII
jgi:hypothetical protein